MGKALGIIALVFGIVSLALSLFSYALAISFLFFLLTFISLGLAVAGIICGAIGIPKDDKAGLAIAGLIVSSIAVIAFIPDFYFLIFENSLFGIIN